MTLEDQIRRMGAARAAEVSTPSWREQGPGRSRRAVAGAAAGVAVAVLALGAIVAMNSDDDVDVDTATSVDPSTIEHWIPAAGVDQLQYPGPLGFLTGLRTFREVALITPTPTGDPMTAEWTRVEGGSSPYQPLPNDADAFRVREAEGIATLSLERNGITVARVISRRHDADELSRRAPELFSISREVALLAETVAGWNGDTVRYVGEPATVDLTATGPTEDQDLVARLANRSREQFAATFGDAMTSDRYLRELFALESVIGAQLTDSFFTLYTDEPPVEVSDAEWRSIVDDVIGSDPIVEFLGSELFAMVPGVPDLARPAASAFESDDGHWSVRLLYEEPTTLRDGGAVDVRIGGVTLTFGPAAPGVVFESLAVESRMSETEARRFAELINGELDRPEVTPTTVVASDPPATPADPPVCGGPSADELDRATHLDLDRTPLDIDRDGVADELFVLNEVPGGAFLFARLADGWTGRVRTSSGDVVLLHRPEGGAASRDLDGDGWVEFFVSASTGVDIVSLPSCDVGEPVDGYFIGIDGEWCIPGGCEWRFTCAADAVVRELTVPGGDFNDHDPSDTRWTRLGIRIADGGLVTTPLPHVDYDPASPPVGAPSDKSSGVVDCSPDREGEIVRIARPECAGNDPPPAEAEADPVFPSSDASFDVDADGYHDELISFIGDNGGVWLVLHLGDGNYTNAIPVWFNQTPRTAGFRPGLVLTSTGDIALADITGNGSREFFLGGFGNTGRAASPAGIDGCELRWFVDDDVDVGGEFFLVIGVGGNFCAPTVCIPRVSCIAGELVYELTEPVGVHDPDVPIEKTEVRWSTTVYRYTDGTFVIDRESETSFLATERPADAPSESDVIDCSP